ncbi:putative polypeptide like protein [Argiope bruennichi]|uniref:Polypeptide N-acetylgalactosaminyltransferase n=1 Tax=Argiope bruennichi TaxID=94029 RepID=A0A8T0FEH8_ARGBR|nr:putative polypeptide like protein [Argiope bruennichi]
MGKKYERGMRERNSTGTELDPRNERRLGMRRRGKRKNKEGHGRGGWKDVQKYSKLFKTLTIHPDLSSLKLLCQEEKYDDDLPPTSVIICFHNEAWSVLLRTVHSVLDRSPPHLIEEVILVDDFSDLPHLGRPLEDYFLHQPKVKIIRARRREGLIRARLMGAAVAKAPILTYLDSHCECALGWLEPLLQRIANNWTTVVCPVIDVIDDETFEYHFRESGEVNVGGFDWNLQFSWHAMPEREHKRRNHTWDPVWSPTMAGGLFSINKKFFERLGTYDSGFDIWGGENLELSFKGEFGDVTSRKELRKRLQCKSFDWYLKNVYPELYIPGEALGQGEYWMFSKEGEIKRDEACLDYSGGDVILYPCHGAGGNQQWIYDPNLHTIQQASSRKCMELSPDKQSVLMNPCSGSPRQKWLVQNYDPTKLEKLAS